MICVILPFDSAVMMLGTSAERCLSVKLFSLFAAPFIKWCARNNRFAKIREYVVIFQKIQKIPEIITAYSTLHSPRCCSSLNSSFRN